jgi:hypothetical protein
VIHIVGDQNDRVTTEIVARAFERSFTRGQIREIGHCVDIATRNAIVVAVNPGDEAAPSLRHLIDNGGKLIVFGALTAAMADIAGVTVIPVQPDLASAADSEAAPAGEMRASRCALRYSETGIGRTSPLRRRYFCRYDFLNEWNNLGYGRIGFGADRWSIAQVADRFETSVAQVEIDGMPSIGAAVTLRDLARGSVLWFARPVGAVDGQDWAVVESFISDHRAGELPSRPCLKGMPHGFGAAVSMRLDCDEDVASARPLFELYTSRGRPISLAVATGRLHSREDIGLISDVLQAGGSVLSHSVTHSPRWGGSGEAAEREARDSRARLEGLFPDLSVRYAVSPFHQNPPYVPGALVRAGYEGFIGGSIASDPEYLMSRAGVPPFGPANIVSHSQSCMLHGDCLLAGDDPLSVFKEAFRLARDSREFFGYLDHPFSERYAYGWSTERARLDAHAEYLSYFEQQCGDEPLLFVNEESCMRFIKEKSAVVIEFDEATRDYAISQTSAAGFALSIGHRGEIVGAGT